MSAIRKVITIDGPSGSGKSTLSKMLAEKLGYKQLNTGSIYRAVAYLCLTSGVDCNDESAVLAILSKAKIELKSSPLGESEILLNDKVLKDEIRTPKVSEGTSIVSSHPKVREALVDVQRNAYPGSNLVAEGRDMGTVIFKDADLKFFVTVDEETRIKRRIEQLEAARRKEGGSSIKPLSQDELNLLKEQMKIEITERDKRDSERRVAPLKAASDAIMIDNSSETLTETLDNMYSYATKRGLHLG